MAGRPDFSQPGSQGSGQTVAVSNRPEIHQFNLNQTADVASGGSQQTDLFAPSGSIYKVRGHFFRADPPSTAASGGHEVFLGATNSVGMLKGLSNYNTKLHWVCSRWKSADTEQAPSGEAAAIEALRSVRATENESLYYNYRNNTDVTQTNNRTISIIVEEERY